MSNIKLCIFDLDETLLNSSKIISPKTIESIKKLKKYNINYTIATGRTHLFAKTYYRQIEATLPMISCNGSLIIDLDNKIYKMTCLDFENVEKIYNFFKELRLDMLFYTENCILITPNNKRLEVIQDYNKNAALNDKAHYEILSDNISNFKDLKFLKCLTYIEDRTHLLKVQDQLKNEFKQLSIVSSANELLDIMPSGINKGNALSILCKHLNISKEEVCVFGDNYNDKEMIEFAGTSFVPENGKSIVKNIANYIIPSNNDDGISFAIENIILKNKV